MLITIFYLQFERKVLTWRTYYTMFDPMIS